MRFVDELRSLVQNYRYHEKLKICSEIAKGLKQIQETFTDIAVVAAKNGRDSVSYRFIAEQEWQKGPTVLGVLSEQNLYQYKNTPEFRAFLEWAKKLGVRVEITNGSPYDHRQCPRITLSGWAP